jgi:hypothetical protein
VSSSNPTSRVKNVELGCRRRYQQNFLLIVPFRSPDVYTVLAEANSTFPEFLRLGLGMLWSRMIKRQNYDAK